MAPQKNLDAFVILPWVHPLSHPGSSDASPGTPGEGASLRIGNRLTPIPEAGFNPPPSPGTTGGAPGAGSGGGDTTGLRTHPTLSEEDRPPRVEEELFSAAVILDILSTSTREIPPEANIFSRLTEVLLLLGDLSGLTEEDRHSQLATADGPEGRTREHLAALLNEHLSAPPLNPPSSAPPTCLDGVATPLGVRNSLDFLEHLAGQLVNEARLLLESQEVIEYRQA